MRSEFKKQKNSTYLSVCVFDGWNVRVTESAVNEAQNQAGFAHATGTKDHNSVIVALFRHRQKSTKICSRKLLRQY